MTRPANTTEVANTVFDEVARHGILLQTGGEFPSATTTITGEPLSGSWWSHPQASLIHWVLEALDEHRELTTVKLINGKVTLVHTSLWPALVAIGSARQSWQMARLSPLATTMLETADHGSFRLDQFEPTATGRPTNAMRALERKLLVHTREVHTEKGRHSKEVQSWTDWARTVGVLSGRIPNVDESKAAFERIVQANDIKLPW